RAPATPCKSHPGPPGSAAVRPWFVLTLQNIFNAYSTRLSHSEPLRRRRVGYRIREVSQYLDGLRSGTEAPSRSWATTSMLAALATRLTGRIQPRCPSGPTRRRPVRLPIRGPSRQREGSRYRGPVSQLHTAAWERRGC